MLCTGGASHEYNKMAEEKEQWLLPWFPAHIVLMICIACLQQAH